MLASAQRIHSQPPRRCDLDILNGAGGISLPIEGDRRKEYGANLDVRLAGFSAFAQVVKEESAGLPRLGFEIEAGD